MPRLPRNLDADELIRRLLRYDYEVSRQTGSHLRLVRTVDGEAHRVTVPKHRPLRVGTLNAILSEIATHLNIGKDELMQKLFG